MKRMLIAAHARFADGLESALSLIMGKREDITCINAFVTETPLEKQIDDYAESLGEGDQVLVITGLMDGAVTALSRRGKLTAFRQRRVEVQTFAHATVSSTKVIWIWFSNTRTG